MSAFHSHWRLPRPSPVTSAATAGSTATLRRAQLCLRRGNPTGVGGFYLCMRGGIESF